MYQISMERLAEIRARLDDPARTPAQVRDDAVVLAGYVELLAKRLGELEARVDGLADAGRDQSEERQSAS